MLPITRWGGMGLMLVALTACGSDPSPHIGPSSGAVGAEPLQAELVAEAVARLDGDFHCAPPRPRAADFEWICSGARRPIEATIRLFGREVEGALFGVVLYTQASTDVSAAAAEAETRELALEVVGVAVPAEWREATASWISDQFPDGGQTMNVPQVGLTAALQPLAGRQWYMEIYELDGRQQ